MKDACLQVSAEALQQSGGAVRSTGTYIGCMFLDYMSLQREGYGMSSTGAVSLSPACHMLSIYRHLEAGLERVLVILSRP